MYSANFAFHSKGILPPNSAYHMNLQQARFPLSDAFAAKLEKRFFELWDRFLNVDLTQTDIRALLDKAFEDAPNAQFPPIFESEDGQGNNQARRQDARRL